MLTLTLTLILTIVSENTGSGINNEIPLMKDKTDNIVFIFK